jgi:hypothetical protein
MTNTTKPANTLTGPVCAGCSTWDGKSRVQRRHATIADVKTCQLSPKVPVDIVVAPTPAQIAELFSAPEATAFNRHFAACYKKDCKTVRVSDSKFILRCYAHGKVVKVRSKQLFGTVSKAAKHHCDDRCIYAKGAVCVCACGGAGHGTGWLVSV